MDDLLLTDKATEGRIASHPDSTISQYREDNVWILILRRNLNDWELEEVFSLIATIQTSAINNYLVTKCGVLMMSLFVFFTTTMSVSFTLRETQTRMLKFTVQLQHHARHRLPTFQLIFVHVIESLVFVPSVNVGYKFKAIQTEDVRWRKRIVV
uniref:Uncharacterized protein n=1 Tax=Solanum lycopersicum TaxID=4081 RepID=A0A3Q7FZV4_SOLLC